MLEFLVPGLLLITSVLYLYKEGFSERWIYFILVLAVPYFIRDFFSLLLFVISSIFGAVTDWIGIKTNEWSYLRKSYPFWIGPSWGYTIVIIYLTIQGLSIDPLPTLFFALVVGLIIDQILHSHRFELAFFLKAGIILFLLYYTDAVLFGSISILMGLFVEYMGCKITKAWKYKTVNFLLCGLSYAGLSWFALRLVQTILAINPITILEFVAICGFIITSYILQAKN